VTNKYFDVIIAAVIGLNVVTMSLEYYEMPMELDYGLKLFNYVFTGVFMFELFMKIYALGVRRYMSERWNRLDVLIVILSLVGILLEEIESNLIPINPTIIRVMRVARIARVLKLLKMAKGMRALLNTVMQALPQVGNLGLLFFLLFFIFAALGVELFGRLECDQKHPCQGMSEHAHFQNFGIAFLTLFRVATGDNWNGIMKDTLRDECDASDDCLRNCCTNHVVAPLYFVVFVLLAQFVLVNVVVAVLMKHLEESHKHMEEDEDFEIDQEIQRELEAEKRALEEKEAAKQENIEEDTDQQPKKNKNKRLAKVSSLPDNLTITFASTGEEDDDEEDKKEKKVATSQSFNQRNTLSPTIKVMPEPDWEEENSSFNNLSQERKLSDLSTEESSQLPSYPELHYLNILTKSSRRARKSSDKSITSWEEVSWKGEKDGNSLSSISTDNSLTRDEEVDRVVCYTRQQ